MQVIKKRPSILIDILSAAYQPYGFSGIPQETRYLFGSLVESIKLDVTGLLWGTHNWHSGNLKKLKSQSIFLGMHLISGCYPSSFLLSILRKIFPNDSYLHDLITTANSNYKLYPLLPDFYVQIISTNFFSLTLSDKEKQKIINSNFLLTNLGLQRVIHGACGKLPKVKLNTQGFDFAIFQDSRAITVSPTTQKIIRYHDAVPLFMSDTVIDEHMIEVHYQSLISCAKNSIYVCSSPTTLADLAKVAPQAAEKGRVIPYIAPTMKKVAPTLEIIKNIAKVRRSKATLPEGNKIQELILEKWFASSQKNNLPCYIMSLSTVEPRKNYVRLIHAWLRLRYMTKKDIKLMIVGSAGWKFEPVFETMRPFIKSGDLLHLENVAQQELPYLYSAASCFAFPSLAEGLGLPPLEAMQCGCPVVSSDISPHRFATGDSALYCDPYDEEDIAEKLYSVLFPTSQQYIDQLREKGFENAKRFSIKAVLPQWENFFDEFKKN